MSLKKVFRQNCCCFNIKWKMPVIYIGYYNCEMCIRPQQVTITSAQILKNTETNYLDIKLSCSLLKLLKIWTVLKRLK